LIDKHIDSRKKKETRKDCYDYIWHKKCMRAVCDYDRFILCFISSIQGGPSITICQERQKEKKKKDQDGKAIKNYYLV
jgi:hypothetical protein